MGITVQGLRGVTTFTGRYLTRILNAGSSIGMCCVISGGARQARLICFEARLIGGTGGVGAFDSWDTCHTWVAAPSAALL